MKKNHKCKAFTLFVIASLFILFFVSSTAVVGQSDGEKNPEIEIIVNDSTGTSDIERVPIDVSLADSPSAPPEESGEVPPAFPGNNLQYNAIDKNGDGITLGEIRTSVDSWSKEGSVGSNDVPITLGTVREVVDYWGS